MKQLNDQLQVKESLIVKLINDRKALAERMESLEKKNLELQAKLDYEREFRLNRSDDSNSPPLQKK